MEIVVVVLTLMVFMRYFSHLALALNTILIFRSYQSFF